MCINTTYIHIYVCCVFPKCYKRHIYMLFYSNSWRNIRGSWVILWTFPWGTQTQSQSWNRTYRKKRVAALEAKVAKLRKVKTGSQTESVRWRERLVVRCWKTTRCQCLCGGAVRWRLSMASPIWVNPRGGQGNRWPDDEHAAEATAAQATDDVVNGPSNGTWSVGKMLGG